MAVDLFPNQKGDVSAIDRFDGGFIRGAAVVYQFDDIPNLQPEYLNHMFGLPPGNGSLMSLNELLFYDESTHMQW